MRPSSEQTTVSKTQIRVRCRSCRNLVTEDAEFCDFCGASMFEDTVTRAPKPLTTQTQSPPRETIPRQEWYPAPDSNQDTMAAVPPPRTEVPRPAPPPSPQSSHERTSPSLAMLSSYGATPDTPPASFRLWHGVILLLFILIFAGGLGAAGVWWWSSRNSAAEAQPQANQSPATSASASQMTTFNQKTANRSADDELKELRDHLASAQISDKSAILTAVEKAERKYPSDYRFTYERAKLFGKAIISHDEAFNALFAAAQKAIDEGKAQDMLDGLMADKDGDFHRLSRGHREWQTLVQALTNNDKAALKPHAH